jgi:type II restriction/modification system DNA methylase subunit YeeA
MTPEHFIATWKDNPLTERAGAQPHFDDLCELLGVDKPRDPDNYCFERGAKKAGGGDGWADVWKRGHFGWENKKPGRDLDTALKQLTDYALKLENPPLLVVCDRERIVIHTAFTGYPDEPREIRIDDLTDPDKRQLLKWVFTDPEKLRPEKSTAAITAEAAGQFAQLAAAMRRRGEDSQRVAHFLVQCLFCMFAEDEALLPGGIFTSLLTIAGADAGKAARRIEKLFNAMRDKNGEYGDHDIPWFNGGLFNTVDVPLLIASDLAALHRAAADMDWRAIDPTIFGTLFERGLDPAARAPLGAHYTDTGTIEKLIRPLIAEPLTAEWEAVRAEMLAKPKKARAAYQKFLLRLNQFRVLDPACGSGNFLYLALKALRDIEKRAHVEAIELGLQPAMNMETGPHNLLGIEINEFAAELARVTAWIGDIQWCRRNGYPHGIDPILKPLDGIEHRDALLQFSPLEKGGGEQGEPGDSTDANPPNPPLTRGASEADWPAADVIVGNPPFLGDKVMRGELGDDYVATLRKIYEGRVPGGADLVTYWFEKARTQIASGNLKAAGLVATNSIRGGANRKVLDRVVDSTRIFEAWSDEPWVNEGAAVRVSLIGFGNPAPSLRGEAEAIQNKKLDRHGAAPLAMTARLDGQPVEAIHADLTAGHELNLTKAQRLLENAGISFMGVTKSGPFDIPQNIALGLLKTPSPNGRPATDVIFPSINGADLAKRPSGDWIINFGTLGEADASLYEAPFEYALKEIKQARQQSKTAKNRAQWWLFERARPEMFAAFGTQPRYIATCLVAKHRFFVWQNRHVVPENVVIVIARSDDTTFGILHSRFHELWSLRLCTYLGVGNDPRYTPTTTFETFPFPEGLTPRDTAYPLDKGGGEQGEPGDSTVANPPQPPFIKGRAADLTLDKGGAAERIAAAAKKLNELREAWLNPPEWVDWVITPEEEQAGFPKRPVAKPGHETDLKKRTLTNLYNARPAWLDLAHKALDQAVAAAYGWTDYTPDMPDDEILRRLLALNLQRAKEGN